ncbi:hypothetical protein [Desertibacillus haloalkaliphilus]|uniref:hypothetical protein n=1 Tax=Desertibacillus haloalkaliphilus TaxID=1328930 RepID=UPI001C261E66|nr:hypothetical protein [Desertibacillus haloalkaliphilus]MBU8906007.1 hypothetical protein [Desertibacillus haloalkaliphilus]
MGERQQVDKLKSQIKEITICEEASPDFTPIGLTNRFTQKNHAVTVIVRLLHHTYTNIRFKWYIASEPNEPLAIYEVPLENATNNERYVTNTLAIEYLFSDKGLNVFQPWFVEVALDDETVTAEFEIYELPEYSYTAEPLDPPVRSLYDWHV